MNRPVVTASFNAPDGVHCVDIRRLANGHYEAAFCRRDPEDPHGWRVLQVQSLTGALTEEAAKNAATALYPEVFES